MALERQPSHVYVLARPSDAESSIGALPDGSALIREQVLANGDTFCVLPTNMRCLCLLLTVLLIISLGAAIGNSIQNSGFKSVSYCKPVTAKTPIGTLCPKESMFVYYSCCRDNVFSDATFCCPQAKVWLIVAMISVVLSFVVGIVYTIVRYMCCC
uniref:Membrane protein UL144 n=1 Tax=Steinernema glaseri TaxID=37863 RepID=A0A1I7ZYA2_9BILA